MAFTFKRKGLDWLKSLSADYDIVSELNERPAGRRREIPLLKEVQCKRKSARFGFGACNSA